MLRKALAIALTLLVVVAAFLYHRSRPQKDDEPFFPESEPIPEVYITTPQKTELYEAIALGGIVRSSHQIPILAPIASSVNTLFVKEGQHVQKGQLILAILPEGMGLEYKDHKIYAPMSGTITNFRITTGQKLLLDQKIAVIENLDAAETVVEASLEDLQTLREGVAVQVILAPNGGNEVQTTGKVTHIAPTADEATHSFHTTVAIDCNSANCRKTLRMGTFVRVLAKQNLRSGYKLPTRYLYEQFSKVLQIKDDGSAHWVPIKIGKNYGAEIEVLQGLDADMRIVTAFSAKPEEGQKVKVLERTADNPEAEGEVAATETPPKEG